ncbi:response regulator transcription factor [Actinokineospora auranticolor]|uniref:DNA-binding NarL/FixJ family response regulator n=1 Tax=Actinokineospora auranticolor TaxID=155976 RepID=A0A2S6GP78_9PSEU|nr:response regulator transcription factor [Actinokineospora auranticolor]PPK67055.1 DNA-binding NarL/FixJ family response regulator [Actinokineospora auranticolor]
MEPVQVVLHAIDVITRAGLDAALRPRREVRLVADGDRPDGDRTVDLVVAETWDPRTETLFRRLHARGRHRVVLVAGEIDNAHLLEIVGIGVAAVVRRAEATPDTLVRLVRATAAGDGALPPDLLAGLLDRVARLQRQVLSPRGWDLAGVSAREAQVLRMIADGLETREIAEQLCYSQRTVKGILHDVTSRFQLRNRAHAVAFALREGLI